jgi:radical SAM protein with 4Fe4S-binding SPASM domain
MEQLHNQRITFNEDRDRPALAKSHKLADEFGIVLNTSIYEATKCSEATSEAASNQEIKSKKQALVRPCPLVFRTIYIRSNGKVKPCCFASDENQLSLGDVTKQTIHEIWNGEKYQELRRAHVEGRVPPTCAHCVEFNLAPPSDAAKHWLGNIGIKVYDPAIFIERLLHAEKSLKRLKDQVFLSKTITTLDKFNNNLGDCMKFLRSVIEFGKEYRNASNILGDSDEIFREINTSTQRAAEIIEYCMSCKLSSEISQAVDGQLMPLINMWFELLHKSETSIYKCIENEAKCI